jgi:hypothetical protein
VRENILKNQAATLNTEIQLQNMKQ